MPGTWRESSSSSCSSPGLYLFIPLILLQTVVTALVEVSFLDTSLLITPVRFAVGTMGTLITCLCLLLLFYTVEALERERSTRLAAIAFATPVRSGAFLLGKSIALAVVAIVVVIARFRGGVDRARNSAKSRRPVPAVLALLGVVARTLDSGVDRLCDRGPDDHSESIHDVCACACLYSTSRDIAC